MEFLNEQTALSGIASLIEKYCRSLHDGIKYIYSIADENFYNIEIKDALMILLNNLTKSGKLEVLSLSKNHKSCIEMNSEEYEKVLSLIIYSFAVRVPMLKKIEKNKETLSDKQLMSIYRMVLANGGENHKEIIKESYEDIKLLVKKKKIVNDYSADWYKAYIYNYVPKLKTVSNKNIFLLGAVDILFPMFYSCCMENMEEYIKSI